MYFSSLLHSLFEHAQTRAVRRSRTTRAAELRHILPEPELDPAKTPADKIMKNYFIFQRTFGNGKIKLNDLKLL